MHKVPTMAQYNIRYSTYAAMCSVLSILARLAVILRFVARKKTKLYIHFYTTYPYPKGPPTNS